MTDCNMTEYEKTSRSDKCEAQDEQANIKGHIIGQKGRFFDEERIRQPND